MQAEKKVGHLSELVGREGLSQGSEEGGLPEGLSLQGIVPSPANQPATRHPRPHSPHNLPQQFCTTKSILPLFIFYYHSHSHSQTRGVPVGKAEKPSLASIFFNLSGPGYHIFDPAFFLV
jgi:hypothetical protein